MDIEKLIEEQEKTREAIKLLQSSKTYEELFEKIPEIELDWKEEGVLNIDMWDYDSSSLTYQMQAAYHIMEAVNHFGKVKKCLGAVRKHYEGSIKQWEEYREYVKTQNKTFKNDWSKMYTNPVCLRFFEDYEKANGITDSIYQEAKKVEKSNARHREYARKRYISKKKGGEK